jgi:hypothetical protein
LDFVGFGLGFGFGPCAFEPAGGGDAFVWGRALECCCPAFEGFS